MRDQLLSVFAGDSNEGREGGLTSGRMGSLGERPADLSGGVAVVSSLNDVFGVAVVGSDLVEIGDDGPEVLKALGQVVPERPVDDLNGGVGEHGGGEKQSDDLVLHIG